MLELSLYAVCALTITIGLFFIVKLSYAFRHFRMKQLISGSTMLNDLPSVTVCVPARNEKDAMTQCLESVIASTYPKLEIIVLDDSSGDNTSILIKSFAHAGVRFVEGAPLPEGWLGKNHALQELLDEASGTYVLFMDVDTHLAPDTIGQLVAYAKQEKAAMISVLPRRNDGWRASVLFSTLRYFWTLVFHRRASPAVASSAWMVERETLRTVGGIAPYKTAIQPEAMIATQLATSNTYRFLISSPLLGLSYEKKWQSQIDTSVRLIFPQLKHNYALIVIAASTFLLLLSPLAIALSAFFVPYGFIHVIAAVELLMFAGIYGVFAFTVRKNGWWLSGLLWPMIVLQECIVLIVSAIRYAQKKVTWKGRPITS